jgi:tetratricopeptide (TPR) repeat protein
VVVFKSDASFRPFKPGANVAGYFQAGEDINYIALTTELFSGEDPFTVIFHEYTHLLINNTSGRVPVWFNEGLAEYYSTFSITDDQKFALGIPIGNHVFLLRESKMLPLRTLFQVDHKSPHYNERDKKGIFYAQSWALMHYLVIGKAGRVDQLGKFMQLVSTNVPMEQAFQQAFEMTFEAMEKELRNYIKQSRYNSLSGHFERKLETDTTMESAPITEAEAQAYLGDLLLHSHRKDSETYIQKALKLDPNLGMAHASLGRLRFYEGKFDEARASLERAVQANSQNYLIHYYYAHILAKSAVGPNGVVTSYPPETSAKIYEELQKVISLRPDYPESYSLLGFVSVVTGERLDESIKLLNQAIAVSPGRSDLLYTIAQLYMRKSDFKSARQLLEQVTKSNAEDELRQRAKTLLDQVVAYQGRVESNAPSTVESADEDEKPADAQKPATAEKPTVNVSTSTSTPAPQVAPDPSAYLREVLRPVAQGETQLQGTLLRIECEGKVIVFFVKVGEQTLRLRTISFDDVEITTYNPEVKGDITCGPKKIDEPAIVCFKPITDKRLKADGTITSIEFVPKDFKLK